MQSVNGPEHFLGYRFESNFLCMCDVSTFSLCSYGFAPMAQRQHWCLWACVWMLCFMISPWMGYLACHFILHRVYGTHGMCDVHVSYRTLVRPTFRVSYRLVTALEWRCCPGFLGEDCREGMSHCHPRSAPSAKNVPSMFPLSTQCMRCLNNLLVNDLAAKQETSFQLISCHCF